MNNQELRIEILLEEVVKKRASDLHIQVGLPQSLCLQEGEGGIL